MARPEQTNNHNHTHNPHDTAHHDRGHNRNGIGLELFDLSVERVAQCNHRRSEHKVNQRRCTVILFVRDSRSQQEDDYHGRRSNQRVQQPQSCAAEEPQREDIDSDGKGQQKNLRTDQHSESMQCIIEFHDLRL